jgi:NAD(P)H-hydrate epimerase
MKLVNTSVMRDLDRRTIEEGGIEGEELMRRAGEGVAHVVRRLAEIAGYDNPLVHVIAGRGNNGGDAFVTACVLKDMGFGVEVWLAGSDDQVQGDALLHMSRLKTARIQMHELPTLEDWQAAIANPFYAEIIVDGVLGTGIAGPARGPAAGAIQYINAQTRECFCVSIDVPSGLNADTGTAEGEAVMADVTVTLGLPKRGLVEPSAVEYVGTVEVADIGIPSEYLADATTEPDRELVYVTDLRPLFKRRRRMSHKGNYGHVLLVGGSYGMMGSIALAARGALRSGAGLVTVLAPESVAAQIAQIVPEAMVRPCEETAEGTLATQSWVNGRGKKEFFDAVLIGPGLGRNHQTLNLVRTAVRDCEVPMIFDADAISVLEGQADFINKTQKPAILTPHPGEMARLIHRDVAEIQADRIGVARRIAEIANAVVVLKGAGTLVVEANKPAQINLTGNPGMATGGTGDVLAGMITSLVGQGLAPYDAARAAVYLHGRAGDLAAWRKCQASLNAGDVLEELPFAFREATLR